MKPEYQRYIYDLLMEAGAEFHIRLFGLRALNALRVEKSFGSWSREFRPLYGPYEAGLGRFVALSKEADFIGKAAAAKEKSDGGTLRLRTFIIEAKDADVIGDEPIYLNGEVRGWVTSGGYAHASGVSVAIGYVPKEIADESGRLVDRASGRNPACPIATAGAFRRQRIAHAIVSRCYRSRALRAEMADLGQRAMRP